MKAKYILNILFLVVVALILVACAPASAQSAPPTPMLVEEGSLSFTTYYMMEVTFTATSRPQTERYYSVGPNDCRMNENGSIFCNTLGGPYLFEAWNTYYLEARPDSEFLCTTGCRVTPNIKVTKIWVAEDGGYFSYNDYWDLQGFLSGK